MSISFAQRLIQANNRLTQLNLQWQANAINYVDYRQECEDIFNFLEDLFEQATHTRDEAL